MSDTIKASKAAADLAEEHGIDLLTVTGTGADGQITKPDVEKLVDPKAVALVALVHIPSTMIGGASAYGAARIEAGSRFEVPTREIADRLTAIEYAREVD